ncbi:MAG: hypothetical protein K2Q06_15950, partial [Parvularculaceae bacterium]|nr:hypothetical protein [Parvularculaceae bacterium]
MSVASRLLRDPLAHFLIAGAALFFLLSALAPPEKAAEKTIDVTREKLVAFIQFRSKAFEPNAAER